MKRIRSLSLPALILCATICPFTAGAQENVASLPDSPMPIADSPTPVADSPATVPGDPSQAAREETWRKLPGDFLHDQKEIWLFPTQLARGRHWLPTLAVAGVTAGLIYGDPHVMPYFRDHSKNLDKLNDVFDPMITTSEVIAVPTALLTAGYLRHDQYQVSTALLAADAYADSAVVDLVVKAITRRERPTDVPVGKSFDKPSSMGASRPSKAAASLQDTRPAPSPSRPSSRLAIRNTAGFRL